MNKAAILVLLAGLSVSIGCAAPAGASAFREIDLGHDLDEATLTRYRSEAESAASAGHHGAVIEYENGWPLGLLAFWKKGEVRVMHGRDGEPQYIVSRSRGYGPLSMFWVAGDQSVYDAEGKRLHSMGVGSAIFGHIYMTHTMENPAPDGTWHTSKSHNVIHHMFNWVKEHGRSEFYLFSVPNPVGSGA
jgi:hypothetical protein